MALDYQSTASGRGRRIGAIGVTLLSLGSLAVMSAVLLPSLNRPRCDYPNRLTCGSNLRQIGQGVQMYAYEHKGAFPDDFAALILTEDITSETFVCYRTSDTRAQGPTTQAVAANLMAGGHLSFVYTGKGMSLNSPPTAVVAYEPLGNHGDGMNVLFADGHTQWFAAAYARKLLSELNAGHNPPRAESLK